MYSVIKCDYCGKIVGGTGVDPELIGAHEIAAGITEEDCWMRKGKEKIEVICAHCHEVGR